MTGSEELETGASEICPGQPVRQLPTLIREGGTAHLLESSFVDQPLAKGEWFT